MDFFRHQDLAVKNSKILVGLFILTTICIAMVTAAVVSFSIPSKTASPSGHAASLSTLFGSIDYQSFAMTTAIVALMIFVVSYFKTVFLRKSGGSAIASQLGGRLILPSTDEKDEQRLLNIVQEMALASGSVVPSVYLLEHEKGINAFAAGYSPDSAVIGVTKGALEQLSRDELQGVIAHEFSHILYGDMKLNMNMIGTLFGISFIKEAGEVLLRSGSIGRSRKRNDAVGIGLALYIVGLLGYFAALVIKAAISRQREFLADASAVQFTRNPKGISGALKRIGGLSSRIKSPRASQASHMFFANGISSFFSSVFGTHPPLSKRLERIEGVKFKKTAVATDENKSFDAQANGTSAFASQSNATVTSFTPPKKQFDDIEAAGVTTSQSIKNSANFLAKIPSFIATSANEPYAATTLVLSIFIHSDHEIKKKQVEKLAEVMPEIQSKDLQNTLSKLYEVDRKDYIPLLDLAAPALEFLADSQKNSLVQCVNMLIMTDDKFELEEYLYFIILCKILNTKPKAFKSQNKEPSLLIAATKLLSTLAYFGHNDKAEIEKAFKSGIKGLGVKNADTKMSVVKDVAELDRCLTAIKRLNFQNRKIILKACQKVVTHDGKITNNERILVRAVSDSLGCPVSFFHD